MLSKYIVSFFFSGLFAGIGVDPEGIIYESLAQIIETLDPGMAFWLRVFVFIIGILIFILNIYIIYNEHEELGLIGIFTSFIFGFAFGATLNVGFFVFFIVILIAVLLYEKWTED